MLAMSMMNQTMPSTTTNPRAITFTLHICFYGNNGMVSLTMSLMYNNNHSFVLHSA